MLRHRIFILVLCQAVLCWLETYLISKISLIGRLGIATVHKEYALLRSGWRTFLLFFGVQVTLIFILAIIQKKFTRKTTIVTASILLAMSLLGLCSTYIDFLHTYSHRLLKERFHLGFYLFWISWTGTCIFFLVSVAGKKPKETDPWPEDRNVSEHRSDINDNYPPLPGKL